MEEPENAGHKDVNPSHKTDLRMACFEKGSAHDKPTVEPA